MSKRTPGPWTIEQDGPWTLVRGNDPELQSEDYPGPLVCTPADNGCTQANAALIAAAPDMLAALKQVRELYADIEIVRAAIAKAEGEKE